MLVVDDEPAFHETLARHLTAYRRLHAYSCAQARRLVRQHHVDVVLLDLGMPDGSGLELLKEWRAERDDFEIVIVTSHAELANAVECVKNGAFDFVAKTFETYQRIGDHVARALAYRQQRRAMMELRSEE